MTDEGQRVVLVSRQARRLSQLLTERGIHATPVADVPKPPLPRSLTLVQGTLAEGWRLRIAEGELQSIICNLLTDTEIFGWARPLPRRAPKPRAITLGAQNRSNRRRRGMVTDRRQPLTQRRMRIEWMGGRQRSQVRPFGEAGGKCPEPIVNAFGDIGGGVSLLSLK